MYIPVL